MQSDKVREAFLDFFKERDHSIIKSSPLIPEGDPSLLFTSAGMVQFKPYFLGIKKDLKRVTSCQKSFRTTDIDNVGKTIRHLTFFEMLGNFSFGDYFKEDAIKWGWEFLTKEMNLPADRFYFTVYGGGDAPKDEEAKNIWLKVLPKNLHSRIFELKEDNFWAMGETGPCGPCSEIYWDRGEKYAHNGCAGPGCECDRYIEVWNHVFTQFDRQTGGVLKPLPKKNIDTGLGLERLVFIMEEKESPFETSLFKPIIESASDILKAKYSSDGDYASNFRIISDHLRASVFLIAEGIIPSNEGRGYILRRLIRRAERFAKIMGSKNAVLYKLAPRVFEIFKDVYPEIKNAEKDIIDVLKFEEEGFLQTLETGEKFLEDLLNKYPKSLPGSEAFSLYETYGFPFELTKEIALKKGIKIDEKGFDEARIKAQDIAKAGWKSSGEKDISMFQKAEEGLSLTEFVSNKTDHLSVIEAFINPQGDNIEKLKGGELGYMAFDKTIFYAESGGQAGDTGFLYKGEELIAEVLDTQKTAEEVFFHKIKAKKDFEIKIGDEIVEKIDFKRHRTAVNHTATHVINAALRKVFGASTRQAGSFVDSERFRFDYTVSHTPSKNEVAEVERIANEAIKENYKVSIAEKSLKEAKELGAVMLLGEKYKDPARLVLINNKGFDNAKEHYSLELCGGTHLRELSSIGGIKIIKESSVSKGIRRIEGVAGPCAIEYLAGVWDIAESIALKLSSGIEDIAGRIDKLIENEKKLKGEIENIKRKSFKAQSGDALSIVDLNGKFKFIFFDAQDAEMKTLRLMVDDLKQKNSSGIIFVFSKIGGKLSFIVSCSDDLKESSFDASAMAKDAGLLIGGRGGGRKDFAQGGGIVPKDIEEFKKQLIEIAIQRNSAAGQ